MIAVYISLAFVAGALFGQWVWTAHARESVRRWKAIAETWERTAENYKQAEVLQRQVADRWRSMAFRVVSAATEADIMDPAQPTDERVH